MELTALGSTGLEVSRLALGTVKLGRVEGLRYAARIPTDDEAAALLHCARELGINLLDTAPAYGSSEERLGKLIANERDYWVVSTKVGETFENNESHHDFSPENVRASVTRSLQRLQTDVLDIVLIHSDGNDREILTGLGTLAALEELKTEGKIRAVGISHKTVDGGTLAVENGADVIMASFSRTYTVEADLIQKAAGEGCGVLIKKALDSGRGSSSDIAYVGKQPGVHSIVVGTTNPEHLRANATALA